MTIEQTALSGPALLDAVRDLTPTITGRAEEIEKGRRLPLDLVEKLTEVGCFRMLLPRSHGGGGIEFPAALRVLQALMLVAAVVTLLLLVVFPWVEPRLPFNEVTTGAAHNPTASADA